MGYTPIVAFRIDIIRYINQLSHGFGYCIIYVHLLPLSLDCLASKSLKQNKFEIRTLPNQYLV